MFKYKKIFVIIPAFNEECSIGRVMLAIPSYVDQVIVVNNGSTDKTAEAAQEAGAEVYFEEEKGYGISCQKGISQARGADIIVILDADFSDHPQQMDRLVEPIVNDEADFVLGSRVLGDCEPGALTPQQILGNRLAGFLINLFFHVRFTDMGPFRAIRRDALNSMGMRDKNFGWNVEMQIKAIKHKLRIKEVPVDYRKRIGESKISGTLSGTLKAGYKIISTILRYALAD